jgi:hypothetical protein
MRKLGKTVRIFMEIEHIKSQGVTFLAPLMFDVFYLHKYSHSFT